MTAVLTPVSLKRHAKVRAVSDLPGVPDGTKGKVLQVTGVTWIRYRVLFEDGVEIGLLDGRHIIGAKDWKPVDQREAVSTASANGAAASDEGDGAAAAEADNEFGVPAHLLERAKAARTRLKG
jgi:hypothetical protein